MIRPDGRVRIEGLTDATELNGQTATVMRAEDNMDGSVRVQGDKGWIVRTDPKLSTPLGKMKRGALARLDPWGTARHSTALTTRSVSRHHESRAHQIEPHACSARIQPDAARAVGRVVGPAGALWPGECAAGAPCGPRPPALGLACLGPAALATLAARIRPVPLCSDSTRRREVEAARRLRPHPRAAGLSVAATRCDRHVTAM